MEEQSINSANMVFTRGTDILNWGCSYFQLELHSGSLGVRREVATPVVMIAAHKQARAVA